MARRVPSARGPEYGYLTHGTYEPVPFVVDSTSVRMATKHIIHVTAMAV